MRYYKSGVIVLMGNTAKHRLNQRDLVMNIFGLFSEEYESNDAGSIWDVNLSLDHIIQKLEEKCDVSYKSDLWVWTQLKRYEEEIGVQLFKKIKVPGREKSLAVSMNYPYINFFQKQHLYVNEKIRAANGVYDKIQHFAMKAYGSEPIRIFLGAGTLCYHVSTIFAERSWQNKVRYSIHTNNLGALNQLIAPKVNHENILVTMPEGVVDSVTYTIVGENNDFFNQHDFDFIIQGTSCIYREGLYIESSKENKRKTAILTQSKGHKILALTKHEFSSRPMAGSEVYGHLSDYDSIVVPRKSTASTIRKSHETVFEESRRNLIPEILNWNYEIFEVHK